MTSGHIGARLEEFVAKRLCAFMQNIDEDIRWRREGRGGRAGGRGSVESGEITKKKGTDISYCKRKSYCFNSKLTQPL